MKIIISPAKKMKVDPALISELTQPMYIKEAKQILATMKKHSYAEMKEIWHVNDKLAQENYDRLQHTKLNQPQTPAILAYSGIQYQYMAPTVFSTTALAYIQQNLRILSGLYGILKPLDGVVPYRLEMHAPLVVKTHKNLYDFWQDKLYQGLELKNEPVLNLASLEYSKAIKRYLKPNDNLINVVFGQMIDGKVKTKATLAKMARGQMVRFMAENNVQSLSELKQFNELNYSFMPNLSTQDKLVFLND